MLNSSSVSHGALGGEDAPVSVGYSTPANTPDQAIPGWCAVCYASGSIALAASKQGTRCVTHQQDETWRPSECHVQAAATGENVYELPAAGQEQATMRGARRSARQERESRRRERRTATTESSRRGWDELSATGRRICQAEAERPTDWIVPEVAYQRLREATAASTGQRVISKPRAILARFDGCEEPYDWYKSRWWRTRAVVWALGSLIDWDEHVIQATGARIAEVATQALQEWAEADQVVDGRGRSSEVRQLRVSERSAYDALRWLEEAEILICLLRGVSAEGLQADIGRAGIYAVLTAAPTKEEDTEKGSESEGEESASPATNCEDGLDTPISRPPSLGGPYSEQSCELYLVFLSAYERGSVDSTSYESKEEAAKPPQRQKDWDSRVPRSTSARTKAVSRLRGVTGWPIRHGRLRSLLDMWFDAEWCPKAIIYALDYTPSGKKHTMPISVAKRPIAVAASRLKYWINPETGLPMKPPKQAVPAGYRAGQRRQVDVREAPSRFVPRRDNATNEGLQRGKVAENAMAALKSKLATVNRHQWK